MKEGLGTGERLKHVETNWFFARDCQRDGDCEFVKIHTDQQTADQLTKSLFRAKHDQHIQSMVGRAYHSQGIDREEHLKYYLVNKPAFAVHLARHLPGVPLHAFDEAQATYCASLRITGCADT